jgi:hypothetical protein
VDPFLHSQPQQYAFRRPQLLPLLGPCVLAPTGFSHAVTMFLDYLPSALRLVSKVSIFAPPHTQRITQQVQAWRSPTNPIDTHSLTQRVFSAPDTELIITAPRLEDAPL